MNLLAKILILAAVAAFLFFPRPKWRRSVGSAHVVSLQLSWDGKRWITYRRYKIPYYLPPDSVISNVHP